MSSQNEAAAVREGLQMDMGLEQTWRMGMTDLGENI